MAGETPTPLIALSACVREIGIHPFHVVGEKYITAVRDGAGGFPLMLPSLGDAAAPDEILARVDGLLFTGSPSNVEPHLYGGAPSAEGTHHDAQRDGATLPLILAAVAAGVPLLCICRGSQELNVALGGTLHQAVHEIPSRLDHRKDILLEVLLLFDVAGDRALAPVANRREDSLCFDGRSFSTGMHQIADCNDVAIAGDQAHTRAHDQRLAGRVAPCASVEFHPMQHPLARLGVE